MIAHLQLLLWLSLTLTVTHETKDLLTIYKENFQEAMSTNGEPQRARNDVIELNNAIDLVLETARKTIAKDGIKVPLPDVNKIFTKKWIKGSFVAKQGNFQNPASIQRTGDVTVSTTDDSITLLVNLGLQDLEASYMDYTLAVFGLVQNGSIHGQVGQNAISLQVTLHYSNAGCAFILDHVSLDQFGDIRLEISGLGPFQSMFDVISKWLLTHFEGNIKSKLDSILNSKLHDALAKHNICKLIPRAYVPVLQAR